MPIVDITVVGPPAPGFAQVAADALGDALKLGPGRLWVKVHELSPDRYAENRSAEDFRPVFVHVVQRRLPEATALAEQTRAIAAVVAMAADRPLENVHVIHEPAGAGRVAFGGELVT